MFGVFPTLKGGVIDKRLKKQTEQNALILLGTGKMLAPETLSLKLKGQKS